MITFRQFMSLAEAIDPKYNEAIRTIHRHVSSDPENPANRTNLARYLERRRLTTRPGGEYYDTGKKSSRPVVPGSRIGLTPQERQRRREEDENVDTRFGSKAAGKYGITSSTKKQRKQRALGELD